MVTGDFRRLTPARPASLIRRVPLRTTSSCAARSSSASAGCAYAESRSFGVGDAATTRVRYIDYLSESEQIAEEYNVFSPFVWKSVAYEHEREVRALFVDMTGHYHKDSPPGHFVAVDLAKLVQRVTVSPLAPPWYEEVVTAICAAFGFTFSIGRSIVFSRPVY